MPDNTKTPKEDPRVDEGFRLGVAYATAIVLRTFDNPSIAREIWEPSGCTLRGVCDFDAKPIRRAIRRGW